MENSSLKTIQNDNFMGQLNDLVDKTEMIEFENQMIHDRYKMVPEMNFENIAEYFNVNLKTAAAKFGYKPTTFRLKCRDCGIKRWPYRKVKSVQGKMEECRRKLDNNQTNVQAVKQLTKCEVELAQIMDKSSYRVEE